MRGGRLRTRYVLAVLLAGLMVTAAVVTTVAFTERHEQQHVREVMDDLQHAVPGATMERLQEPLRTLSEHVFATHLLPIAGIGILLSLLAASATWLLIGRIDRAMNQLMRAAERIGGGQHGTALPRSEGRTPPGIRRGSRQATFLQAPRLALRPSARPSPLGGGPPPTPRPWRTLPRARGTTGARRAAAPSGPEDRPSRLLWQPGMPSGGPPGSRRVARRH